VYKSEVILELKYTVNDKSYAREKFCGFLINCESFTDEYAEQWLSSALPIQLKQTTKVFPTFGRTSGL